MLRDERFGSLYLESKRSNRRQSVRDSSIADKFSSEPGAHRQTHQRAIFYVHHRRCVNEARDD